MHYKQIINSTTRKILVDVGQQASTTTFEYFNLENQRLFRDSAGTNYTAWDNAKSLLDT